MAYLRPLPVTQRFFNPLAISLGLGGAAALTIPRRSGGKAQTVPVIPVERGGATFLVSTRGDSDWVRNLRAVGTGQLKRRSGAISFSATEVPIGERAPVIADYRRKVGMAVDRYFRQLPDPADHPVFRLEPIPSH